MLNDDAARSAHKKKFLECLAEAKGLIATACRACGIARRTIYDWRKADPEFEAQLQDITEIQIDKVESKLLDFIDSGDTTAAIFYLKSKAKNRGYGDAIQGEITVRFEDEP